MSMIVFQFLNVNLLNIRHVVWDRNSNIDTCRVWFSVTARFFGACKRREGKKKGALDCVNNRERGKIDRISWCWLDRHNKKRRWTHQTFLAVHTPTTNVRTRLQRSSVATRCGVQHGKGVRARSSTVCVSKTQFTPFNHTSIPHKTPTTYINAPPTESQHQQQLPRVYTTKGAQTSKWQTNK